MSSNINNKLNFINNFQFLNSSLNSLVKKLEKNDFKYLSQEFDSKISNLLKQKRFYPYQYMSDIEKFREELPSKEYFIVCLKVKKLVIMNLNMFLMFGIPFKTLSRLVLKI